MNVYPRRYGATWCRAMSAGRAAADPATWGHTNDGTDVPDARVPTYC